MLKLAPLAALIASVAWCANVHAHDAVFYDGVFDLGKGPVGRWELGKLRDWVWTHWHAHSPATATLHSVSMEGEGFDSQYAIARDPSGALYLSVHTTGWQRPDFPGHEARWRDDWLIAYTIARTSQPYHDDWPGKPIAHSGSARSHRYVLELRDKQGKVVTHF